MGSSTSRNAEQSDSPWPSDDPGGKLAHSESEEGVVTKTEEPTKMQMALVAVIALTFTVEVTQCAHYMAFLPVYFLDNGLSESWIGYCMGVQYGVCFVTVYFARMVAEKGQNVIIVPTALVCMGVVQILTGLFGGDLTGDALGWFTIGARTLIGMCDSFIQLSGMATILRIVPERDVPKWLALVETTRILGNLATPVIGTQIFVAVGFRGEFVIVGIGALVMASIHLIFLWHAPKDIGNQKKRGASPWLLVSRPPIISIMITTAMTMLPMMGYEPALEPYLTSPPINMTVSDVGLFFFLVACCDITGAVLSPLFIRMYGQVGCMFMIPIAIFASLVLLGRGPQTVVCSFIAFAVSSFGVVPISIVGSQLIMRICRTYDLEPKRYAEVIGSIFAMLNTGLACVFGTLAGTVVDAIGFRDWVFIGAWLVAATPFVSAVGFSPWAMGRPMANALESGPSPANGEQKA